MNCTKMLHVFGGHSIPQPVMSADLAMHMCLSQSPPLCHLLGMSPLRSPRPRQAQPSKAGTPTVPSVSSLSSEISSFSPSSLSSERSDVRSAVRVRGGTSYKKKHVVFADSRGLSLTAVRHFLTEPQVEVSYPSPGQPKWPLLSSTSSGGGGSRLRLGFPQPWADPLRFRARLREALVQLESCGVTDTALTGTVHVRNLRFEKAVVLRVTFDSWRSHRDFPCSYLRQLGSDMADTDVFGFSVPLPAGLDPRERLEFCVRFQPGGAGAAPLWDNNGGQNYRLHVEGQVPTVTASQRAVATTRTPQRPAAWPRSNKGQNLNFSAFLDLPHSLKH